jgi:hypothetical protein
LPPPSAKLVAGRGNAPRFRWLWATPRQLASPPAVKEMTAGPAEPAVERSLDSATFAPKGEILKSLHVTDCRSMWCFYSIPGRLSSPLYAFFLATYRERRIKGVCLSVLATFSFGFLT